MTSEQKYNETIEIFDRLNDLLKNLDDGITINFRLVPNDVVEYYEFDLHRGDKIEIMSFIKRQDYHKGAK